MRHLLLGEAPGHWGLKEAWLATHPPRVLLAEDDDEIRGALAEALRQDGLEVFEAPDGAFLQELIDDGLLRHDGPFGPDLVITDICMPGAGSRARVVVRDHGLGIAPEDQERIFGRFERAAQGTRAGGFGLGLWIARSLVTSMGGTLTLESQRGAGATFTVELPLEEEGPIDGIPSSSGGRRRRAAQGGPPPGPTGELVRARSSQPVVR